MEHRNISHESRVHYSGISKCSVSYWPALNTYLLMLRIRTLVYVVVVQRAAGGWTTQGYSRRGIEFHWDFFPSNAFRRKSRWPLTIDHARRCRGRKMILYWTWTVTGTQCMGICTTLLAGILLFLSKPPPRRNHDTRYLGKGIICTLSFDNSRFSSFYNITREILSDVLDWRSRIEPSSALSHRAHWWCCTGDDVLVRSAKI